MQTAVQFASPVSLPGPTLVGTDPSNQWPVAGVSAVWRKLLLQADMAAPHIHLATVEGEPGSGKQTLARYLMSRSPHAGGAFQRRDAREWLLEGDPTLASGFLYLDRVDLLTVPGQNLLLNLLKNLQAQSASRVLLVASSHTSLRQMASQGVLYPDLAFRLTAVRFAIPALRTRKEDLSPIAQALLDSICARYQHRPLKLGPGALARLLQHPWPGNVRELASVLEGALFEAESSEIAPENLALGVPNQDISLTGYEPQPAQFNLDRIIQKHVEYVLNVTGGNKLKAARQLGISRSTLYRILANETAMD